MTSPRHTLLRGLVGLAAVVLVALLGPARPAGAHDVPDELVFYAHVAPEADRLHMPLRVPLVWLVDYGFPKRGPGYIDLADTDGVEAALALAAAELAADIALFEDGRRLEPELVRWRLSLPSDRSFDEYGEAIASIAAPPLPSRTNLFWNQGFADVHVAYPIDEETSTFSLHVEAAALAERVHILTAFVAPDGAVRAYDLLGTMGRVELNGGPGYLTRLFATQGLANLVTTWEHVLFVATLALALARRPANPLRSVVTFAAVVALVVLITGAAAGLDGQFAQLLVATAAAASLLVVAVGNVVARDLRRRWLTVAVCAVPHGLLLAGGLEPILQFRDPGEGLPLLAYTVGALAGVAVVFAAALGIGWLAARHPGLRQRGPVVAALLVGYVGWRDTLERADVLRSMPPPALEPATLVGVGRWAALMLLVLAALWLVFELVADHRGRVAGPAAQTAISAPGRSDPDGEPEHREPVATSGNGQAPTVVAANARPEQRHRNGTGP